MQPVIPDNDVASLSHKGRQPGPLATRLIGRLYGPSGIPFPGIGFLPECEHVKCLCKEHPGLDVLIRLPKRPRADAHPQAEN